VVLTDLVIDGQGGRLTLLSVCNIRSKIEFDN